MTRFHPRRLGRRLAVLALTACGGCLVHTAPVGGVDRSPLIVDDAMRNRDWPATAAKYANGETVAYPTGFVLGHNPDAPKWTPVVTDGPLFVANVLAMPIGYLFTPPWTPVTYPRGVVPPTYNAMPPLPPER